MINATTHSKPVRIVASIGLLPTAVSTLGKGIKQNCKEFIGNVKDEIETRKVIAEEVYPSS